MEDFVEKIKKIKEENKPKLRICRFEPWEIAFLKANFLKMTDKQMAEELRRNEQAIYLQRKKYGLNKNKGRPQNKDIIRDDFRLNEQEIVKEEYNNLSKEQKRKLFDARFKATKRFEQLKIVLEDNEIDFYSERWMDYINTWETLLTTEEDTLHLAIIELIRANRILSRQRAAMQLTDDNPVPIDMYDRQYKECVDTYNKLMSSLSGTRQQRLSTEKEEKFSLTTIIQALQDEETRKKVGREAAVIEAAKKYTADGMRSKSYLLD